MNTLKFFKILSIALTGIIFMQGCGPNPEFSEEVEASLPEKVDFNFHIKPILSDRCFACHGPDENAREAGLRLDTKEGAFAALGEEKDHYAIVPGDLGDSQLFHRITSEKEDFKMPPPESNLELNEKEIALITKWIEQGAEWKPHWSFLPPKNPEVPQVNGKFKVNNAIDNFVLDRLEREKLQPNERASKETLIRRLSFDLTGLPPTVEEIDRFLNDDSPDAYEKLVDRMLNKETYGERLATNWLDIARYADSHGYQDDGMRTMWPWRDWVIKAFNQNMPYDKFVKWQLAGDLLENPSKEQRLATAFNRNHPQSQEGGIIAEEYRNEYVADRTDTFGKAFLGLTIECARCHDHKYDPVSQKEYYQLYGFFNNVNEYGQIPYTGEPSPTIFLTDKEVEDKLSFIDQKINKQKTLIKQEKYQQDFEKWLASRKPEQTLANKWKGLIGHYPLDQVSDNKFTNLANHREPAYLKGDEEYQPKTVKGKIGNAQEFRGDGYVGMGDTLGFFERNEPFSMSIWVKTLGDSIKGPIFSKSGGLMNGNRGYDFMLRKDQTLSASLNHTFPDNSIEVHTKETLPAKKWNHLVFTYDGSSKADGISIFLNGDQLNLKVITDNLKASILHFGKEEKNWGGAGTLRIGNRSRENLDNAMADEFMVFNRELTELEVAKLYGKEDPSNNLITKAKNQINSKERDALMNYYLDYYNREYNRNLTKLTKWRGKENEVYTDQIEVMVMRERNHTRPTYILDRGNYDAPTKRVYPGTPSHVMEFPDSLKQNRLGLAKWLFSKENPLTARVTVNRYWQMLFGRGIVGTPGDFGNQGDLPTHPQLLDWLAIYFRESGWDVKALLKKIVMSATYQQSSVVNQEERNQDPDNLLLARGSSFRLSAEMVRDNALAASGLLVKKIGGPSVKPYQPDGLWKELATRNVTEYVQDHGDSLYRRSMYTIWKRSSPPPSMISFDASERFTCEVNRQNTNTPLQALVLLNDPQYVEASRILAEKMILKGGNELSSQITYGYRALTSHKPDQKQLALLQELYNKELKTYQKKPEEAEKLLSVGEYPRNKDLKKEKVAALAMVANTVINFDEAIMRR